MVRYAFLLRGWVEFAGLVKSVYRVWGVGACGAGQGLVGVEYSCGVIIST